MIKSPLITKWVKICNIRVMRAVIFNPSAIREIFTSLVDLLILLRDD